MLLADSPPKELSMTVIRVAFKTVHEKSSLKGVSLVDGSSRFAGAFAIAYGSGRLDGGSHGDPHSASSRDELLSN